MKATKKIILLILSAFVLAGCSTSSDVRFERDFNESVTKLLSHYEYQMCHGQITQDEYIEYIQDVTRLCKMHELARAIRNGQ